MTDFSSERDNIKKYQEKLGLEYVKDTQVLIYKINKVTTLFKEKYDYKSLLKSITNSTYDNLLSDQFDGSIYDEKSYFNLSKFRANILQISNI